MFLMFLLISTCHTAEQNCIHDHKNDSSCETHTNRNSISNGNDSTVLYIMALAPYPDAVNAQGWDGGPALIPAARLAVEQMNNRSNFMGSYRLKLIEINSGCYSYPQYNPMIKYTENLFYSRKNIVGIVGPACSSIAVRLGQLSAPTRVPLVGVTIASSHKLQNKSLYPYNFKAVGSVNEYIDILLELAAEHQWKKIGVVFAANSVYFKDILSHLLIRYNSTTLNIVTFPLYDSNSPLPEILESQVRIIVVLSPPKMTEKLMCDAYKHVPRLTHPVYQWLFVERSHITFGVYMNSGCTKEDIFEAFENSMLLTYSFETHDRTSPTESGLKFDDIQSAYMEKVRQHEQETGLNITKGMPYALTYAPVYYDAVWALGLGLKKVIESDIDLSRYRPPNGVENYRLAETLKKHISALDFKGASGRIKFDNDTGQANSTIKFLQVRNGVAEEVGIYTYSSGIMCYNCSFINDTFKERVDGMPISIAAIEVVITGCLFIVAAILHILNFMYSSHKSVKASSPYLNHLIFIGYYIMGIAITTYVLAHTDVFPSMKVKMTLCLTYQWELSIGINLVLSTVCMKTWRIYRIFIHYRNPGGKLLSNPILFVFALLLLIPVICTLACGTFVDHITWISTTTLMTNDSENMPVFVTSGSCVFPLWFLIVSNLYSALLLLSTLCLAVLSRHVNIRYRTTKSTSALIFTLTVITGLGLPVVTITKAHVMSGLYHILLCIYLDGILLVFLIFLLLPPLVPLIAEKWTTAKELSRRGSDQNSLTAALRQASNVTFQVARPL